MNYLEEVTKVPIQYEETPVDVVLNIDEIQEGSSQDKNFLYFRFGTSIKIYDRVCDHNGGRLSIRGENASCPLHGWELELSSGLYTNARCSKTPILEINEYELDSPLVTVARRIYKPTTESWCTDRNTEIKFINHACLIFKMGEITFATDPWIIGSAFCNGWWLAKSSSVDAFEELNKCDFIYISHNHPDHLHPESLDLIRKDMPILTAGFESQSTIEYLQHLGFSNVTLMDFSSSLIDHKREIRLSVLKSGDFRDDSGLLVQHGKFKCLLTVDSNFLNFGKLPSVDVVCSSFAGGASGFPLCFENYTEDEKKSVVTRNRGAIRATTIANIKSTTPKYFMPYAGFFTEAAERDRYIKERNHKNSVEDFESICVSNDCSLLNVNEYQCFGFDGSLLVSKRVDDAEKLSESVPVVIPKFNGLLVDEWLLGNVIEYFKGCSFKDELIVDLLPTDENFLQSFSLFRLDFSSHNFSVRSVNDVDNASEREASQRGLRYLQIKVRKNELLDVIREGKPWEDLSIGFQCRIYRSPNVYNSEFWFYFTNVYVGNKVPKFIPLLAHK
jgi:CMP-N-acetylneuraminate monooxygenase